LLVSNLKVMRILVPQKRLLTRYIFLYINLNFKYVKEWTVCCQDFGCVCCIVFSVNFCCDMIKVLLYLFYKCLVTFLDG
jgi:hypothetical protein